MARRLEGTARSQNAQTKENIIIDKHEIARQVIEVEKSSNERWSVGDNCGYPDAVTDDASYFDLILDRILVGWDEVRTYIDSIYSNPDIVRSDYGTPSVHVSETGDLAVLAYNLHTLRPRRGRQRNAVPCLERRPRLPLIDGRWRIAHSNWAFSQTLTDVIAS